MYVDYLNGTQKKITVEMYNSEQNLKKNQIKL